MYLPSLWNGWIRAALLLQLPPQPSKGNMEIMPGVDLIQCPKKMGQGSAWLMEEYWGE